MNQSLQIAEKYGYLIQAKSKGGLGAMEYQILTEDNKLVIYEAEGRVQLDEQLVAADDLLHRLNIRNKRQPVNSLSTQWKWEIVLDRYCRK